MAASYGTSRPSKVVCDAIEGGFPTLAPHADGAGPSAACMTALALINDQTTPVPLLSIEWVMESILQRQVSSNPNSEPEPVTKPDPSPDDLVP